MATRIKKPLLNRVMHLRLDDELMAFLSAEAAKKKTSASYIARQAIIEMKERVDGSV